MKVTLVALVLALFGFTSHVNADESHPHPGNTAPTTEAAPAVEGAAKEVKKVTKKAKKAKKAVESTTTTTPAEGEAAPAPH